MNANNTRCFDELIAQADRYMVLADERENADLWVEHFMIKLNLMDAIKKAACGNKRRQNGAANSQTGVHNE